ncbi:MAG: hypothetical protein ACMUHU_04475 [Thermoplasmatota archaeon]
MSGMETRKILLRHIIEHPGISFNLLMSVFKMSEGNLRYHLNVLEKERAVRSSLMKGKRCYFPYDSRTLVQMKGRGDGELSKSEKRVLNLLETEGVSNWKGLILRTGLSRSELTNALRSLKSKGLIISSIADGKRSYRILTRDLLVKRIERLLMVKLVKGEIDEETYLLLEKEIMK